MLERWALYSMFIFLSAESLIGSFVGPQVANVIVVAPLALLAYRTLVVRPALSAAYRLHTSQFIVRAMQSRAHAWTFILFLGSFGFSFLRAMQFGTFDLLGASYQAVKWGSVAVILFAVAIDSDRHGDRAPILRGVVIGWAVYAGVNLAFIALGLRNSALDAQYLVDGGSGSMFALLGLDIRRIPLPISGGLNTAGLQVAAGVAIGLAVLRGEAAKSHRAFGGLLFGMCLLALMLTDSRGGMLGALAGAAIVVAPATVRARARWIAVGLPFLPLLLLLLASLVQNESWARELQRGSIDGVGGVLTGRPLIWGSIVLFLSSFQIAHIFGFGALGQLGSGVSEMYSAVFSSSYATPVGAGAHNTLLQAVLDVGYFGALLQLMLLWHLLSAFGRVRVRPSAPDPWATTGLGATVALIFIGLTGETFSIVTPNTLVLFLALNIHCLAHQSSQVSASRYSPLSKSLPVAPAADNSTDPQNK